MESSNEAKYFETLREANAQIQGEVNIRSLNDFYKDSLTLKITEI